MDFIDLKHLCHGCMSPLENPGLPCPKCHWQPNTPNGDLQLPPGTLLKSTAGNFLIGRALGQGGFGITYIAWDIDNKLKVAVKEYFPSKLVTRGPDRKTVRLLSDNPDSRRLLERGIRDLYREADTLAKFAGDPSIVTVRAIFKANETAYIVMEFVEGQTFKDMIAQAGRPIPLADVVEKLRPIMKALTKVHEAGIVHRDISPDNIIIENDGTVKLIDFGAARSLSAEGERSLTVMFKMGYAPPEQFQTHGNQGPWTDVYALAATVYHAVTGQKPVSTTDRWMGADTLEMPSSLPGVAIPPQGEQAILKGMALKIEDRYQTVKEFYEALKGAPPQAIPEQGFTRPIPPNPGNPPPIRNDAQSRRPSSGKMLLAGLLAAAIAGGVMLSDSSQQPSGTSSPPAVTTQNPGSSGEKKEEDTIFSELSLDLVSLDMPTSDVALFLDETPKSQKEIFPGLFINEYSNMQVYLKGDTVCGLYSTDASVETTRGIHPGAQENEIEEAYGPPSETRTPDAASKLYIYRFNSDSGIPSLLSFFVTNGKVKHIEIETEPLAELAGAVQSLRYFHAMISAHNYKAAYDCFSNNMKRRFKDYNSWAFGYEKTIKSEITQITAVDQSKSDRIALSYVLRAVDEPGWERFFNGKVTFIKDGTSWKIDSVENQEKF